jgi:hypothetical protein
MNHNLKQHFIHALRLAPVFVFPLLGAMLSQDALALPIFGNCSRFGEIPYLDIPSGETCIDVDRDGLKVRRVTADFESLEEICNWRYDIVYTESRTGKVYSYRRGPTSSGCSRGGKFTVTYGNATRNYTNVREGEVCGKLYQSGRLVDAACAQISP